MMTTIKQAGTAAIVFLLLLPFIGLNASGATVTDSPKASITIHKLLVDTDKNLVLPQDGQEIKDANSKYVYQDDDKTRLSDLAGMNDINFTVTRLKDNTTTVENADPYTGEGAYSQTKKTAQVNGKNGVVRFDNLPYGVYLIEEAQGDYYEADTEKFLLEVPMGNPAGDGLIYDIHIYPKNRAKRSTDFTKEVKERIGNEITWEFGWVIPSNIQKGITLTITDNLDGRLKLKYENGSPVVSVWFTNRAGNTETLAKQHYIVTDKNNIVAITIDKTEGFNELAKALSPSSGSKTPRLMADITTVIEPNVEGRITNSGLVEFKIKDEKPPGGKPPGGGGGSPPVKPKVDPKIDVKKGKGGICIYKYDGKTKAPLTGAEFKVYASYNDAKNGRNPVASGTVSSADGYLVISGLPYEDGGTSYWVVETKAPANYEPLKYPVEVKVHDTSHLKENRLDIENNGKDGDIGDPAPPDETNLNPPDDERPPGDTGAPAPLGGGSNTNIPRSGGMGTIPYYLAGTLFLAGAGFVFCKYRLKGR